jgi:hypothetical protein
MKRINPDTDKPFKRGDKRPSSDVQDGKVFCRYKKERIKKTGYIQEEWQTPQRLSELNNDQKKRQKIAKEAGSPKRLNPETKQPFKRGDKGSDGRYFIDYGTVLSGEGKYLQEHWGDYDTLIKRMMHRNVIRIKNKCKEREIPFDIDVDYLMSIYPKDYKCPVLGFKFEVGTKNIQYTHSIDRIVPSKGYVKGNLVIISKLANQIKSSATLDQLMLVAIYFNKLFHEYGEDADEKR